VKNAFLGSGSVWALWVLGLPLMLVTNSSICRNLKLEVLREEHPGKKGVPRGDTRLPDGSVLRAVPAESICSKSREVRVHGRPEGVDRVFDPWDDQVSGVYEQEVILLSETLDLEDARRVQACLLLIAEGLPYREVCAAAWPAGDGEVLWQGPFPSADGMAECHKDEAGNPRIVFITRGSVPRKKKKEVAEHA